LEIQEIHVIAQVYHVPRKSREPRVVSWQHCHTEGHKGAWKRSWKSGEFHEREERRNSNGCGKFQNGDSQVFIRYGHMGVHRCDDAGARWLWVEVGKDVCPSQL
jgi:hypothetical protein